MGITTPIQPQAGRLAQDEEKALRFHLFLLHCVCGASLLYGSAAGPTLHVGGIEASLPSTAPLTP
jgi:hypothetical protein